MKPTFLRDRVGVLTLASVWGFNLAAGFIFASDALIVLSAIAIVICVFWAALVG